MKLPILLIFVVFKCLVCNFIEDVSVKKFKREISRYASTKSIKVAALGRTANLGELYDATADHFLGVSIYRNDVPATVVETVKDPRSNIEYVLTESLSEKLEKLGVSSSAAVSYLAGMISVSGSAIYLNQYKKTMNSAKTSIMYSLRTVRENLKISSKTYEDLTCLLDCMDATHVVFGIYWGTNVVLSLEETDTTSLNTREIQKSLEDVSKLITSFPSSVIADVEKSKSFRTYIYSDIILNMVPQTINDSIHFIKNTAQLIDKEYSGKGVKVSYILMPLTTVRKAYQLKSNKTEIVKYIPQELVDEFIEIFQELRHSELLITDVYNDMVKCPLVIPDSDLNDVLNLKNKFNSFKHDLRRKFSDIVFKFRSGCVNGDDLKNFTITYESIDLKPKRIEELLQPYTSLRNKILVLNLIQEFGAFPVCHKTDVNNYLAESYRQEVRIISVDLTANLSSVHVRKIVNLLREEKEKGLKSTIKYFIEDDPNSTYPNVRRYVDGELLNSSAVDSKSSNHSNTVSCSSPQPFSASRSSSTVPLSSPSTSSLVPQRLHQSDSIASTPLPIEKKEYVILISRQGDVIVLDGKSLNQISVYKEPQLYYRTVAIVNDIFYNVDTANGHITTTNIKNLIAPPVDSIKWDHVMSFESNCSKYRHSKAAVNGSSFYFTVPGVLFEYNTALKCLTNHGKLFDNGARDSVIVNNILYTISGSSGKIYAFDGSNVTEMAVLNILYAQLFEMDGKICIGGGGSQVVRCYDDRNGTFTVFGYINKIKEYPGIAKTQRGILFFDGVTDSANKNNNSYVPQNCCEILYPGARNWSYIPGPPAMVPEIYSVISI